MCRTPASKFPDISLFNRREWVIFCNEMPGSRALRSGQNPLSRALLARQGVSGRDVNSICNICFIVAQHNQSIGSKRPSAYLEEFRRRKHFARVMHGHLIPHRSDSPVWDDNIRRAFREFSKHRLKLICEAFETRAMMRLFRRE